MINVHCKYLNTWVEIFDCKRWFWRRVWSLEPVFLSLVVVVGFAISGVEPYDVEEDDAKPTLDDGVDKMLLRDPTAAAVVGIA